MGTDTAFEERADYIEDVWLVDWHVDNALSQTLQEKLLGRGAKLIVRPRGCGKTHQMRVAQLCAVKDPAGPLAIFVSFNRYYHLEPLLHKVPNAIRLFHTWVLARILLGIDAASERFILNCGEREDQFPVPRETLKVIRWACRKGD